MFARQWFGPGTQHALHDDSIMFESLVRKRKYSKAINLGVLKGQSAKQIAEKDFWDRQISRASRLKARDSKNSTIEVAFTRFWPGFQDEDNEIYYMLKRCASLFGAKIKINKEDPDLVIYSCFGNSLLNEYKKATRILYLGENVRPHFGDTDYSLSFDHSDYCGRNIYLPLWILRSSRYASRSAGYDTYDPKCLELPNRINNGRNSIVYVGNNSTPHRVEAIYELRRLGVEVDCYGSQTRPVTNKLDTLKQYRYNLCFENSFSPGYVTEKIVDAFMAGSYPLYLGGISSSIFNLNQYFVCNEHLFPP